MEKQIDYTWKIGVYEGKKAKVIFESWNDLKIVLQEDWKYRSAPLDITKNQIELLDKRKRPDRYLSFEEQREIVDWCTMMVRNTNTLQPIEVLYKRYLKYHKEKLWMDISDIKNKIKFAVKTRIQIMVKDIEDGNATQPVGVLYIERLEKRLEEAKKLWIDVIDIKNKIPQLTKLIVERTIKIMVKNIKDPNQLTDLLYIEWLKKELEKAKKLWSDVSDVESKMNELTELAVKKTA